MSARHTRKQDPFARINSWDDGYEYIRDLPRSPPARSDPDSYYEPARNRDRARRPAWDDPSTNARDSYARGDRTRDRDWERRDSRREPRRERPHQYPTPPDSDEYQYRRRPGRHASPPPPNRSARSPSPPRRPRRDPLPRSKSMREPPRRFSPSPSPSPSPARRRRRSSSPTRAPRRPASPRRAKTQPAPTQGKASKTGGGFAGLSPRWQQAAAAALQAGSVAALNMRSQPGRWGGEKGARVATAALGAAAMNAFRNGKDKDQGTKVGGSKGRSRSSGVDALGGMLGGFLVDQLTKGDKKGRKH